MHFPPARRLYRLGLGACLALVSVLAFAPVDQPLLAVSDKTNHVLAFAVIAWLADGAYPGRDRAWTRWASVLGYGLFIEAVQHFLPYRDASALDVAANALGIALYIAASAAWARMGLAERRAA